MRARWDRETGVEQPILLVVDRGTYLGTYVGTVRAYNVQLPAFGAVGCILVSCLRGTLQSAITAIIGFLHQGHKWCPSRIIHFSVVSRLRIKR